MSDLDLMNRFRADMPSAGPNAMARARAQLLAEATTPATAPSHHVRRARLTTRWAWRLAPAAGLALAIVVGLATVDQREPGPDVAGPPADARMVLQLAAAQARETPAVTPRPDQFVYVESVVAFQGYDGDNYVPPVRKHRQAWKSVDGTRDGWLDEKAYDPGHQGLPDLHVVLGASCSRPGPDCVPAYLGSLPTQKDAMREYLAADSPGDSPVGPWMFRRAGDLIQEGYVPPEALAAVFDTLATISGVEMLPGAVDPAGRPGVAVAVTNDGFRLELIFDATTHEYLGAREVKVGPASNPGPAAPGTRWFPQEGPRPALNEVVGAVSRTRIAIVDQARQIP
ncbi:CU044_5270 family protein [Plantactinospora sp. KLBMP9567]|uniref:CU044_5270 family protein n=1 Tax=Plantactinospora sp. KLBMP9567 TaxID=3085900 RepID=UPI002980A92E|nr:CU044_5270 family protein [Plantactinospora sp. KLBMP9567]MDW5327206.1 CU044_5270 family protein [Plantactinospora sp. KLBMP9567]